MKINSAFQSGVRGIQRGMQRVEKVASDIANNGSTETFNPVSNTDNMVVLNEQKRNIQASVSIIKTANNMIGSILDIRV